jgi:hypothetical protein
LIFATRLPLVFFSMLQRDSSVLASVVDLKISPGLGASPPGRKKAADAGHSSRYFRSSPMNLAYSSGMGKPRAASIAGAATSQ